MDDDLSRRLRALRCSLEPQSTTLSTPENLSINQEDALAIRFKKIATKSPSSKADKTLVEKTIEKGFKQELSVEELINALSPENDVWAIEQIDENEIEKLLEEAKASISTEHTEVERRKSMELMPDWSQNNTLENFKNDTDAEGDILRMIKDEIAFEAAHGIDLANGNDERLQRSDRETGSVPQENEFDEDLLKRFEALGGLELPHVPKTEPITKQRPTFSLNHPEPDESDTWCCICNQDGEYRCSGCENDIYCAICLYEAHTGTNAGYEERKHKWTKYIKPDKLPTY